MKFLKKEFIEYFKTYRFIVIFALFLFFAFLNAPTARYMKDILKLAGEGMAGAIPDPVYTDSYAQFFSNTSTIMIAMIIIYMSVITGEIKRGTVYLVLSKGLKRSDFYFSKLIVALVMYTAAYVVSAMLTIFYTQILFGQAVVTGLFSAMFAYWLFGLLILTATIFGSAISKHSGIAVLFGLGSFFLFPLLSMIKGIGAYIPGRLSSLPMELIAGTTEPQAVLWPSVVTIGFIIILSVWGLSIFKNREL